MLYRQKYDVFIRHFGDIGYIVNQAMLSDRVVNASGAVFLDAISREAKDIDSIVSEIASKFYDPPDGLKEDIISFYKILEDDGFLIIGQTIEELDEKDKHHLVIDIDEAKIVKTVFNMALDGLGKIKICKYLNNNHILCRKEIVRRKKNKISLDPNEGDIKYIWSTSSIGRMLNNETYIDN